MKKTKNVTLTAGLLYSLLGLSVVHFLFLMLGLFNVVTPAFLKRDGFNYIISFVLVALVLGLYVLFLFIENKKNLIVPAWFKIVLYIGLYLFIDLYYYFGLYETITGLIFAYIFLAFILNIFALAIFYNSQKSEGGQLKASTSYVGFSTIMISVALGAVFEIIVSCFKLIFIKESAFATLSVAVLDLSVILLVSLVMCVMFSLSHARSKQLLNGCLIKVYKNDK